MAYNAVDSGSIQFFCNIEITYDLAAASVHCFEEKKKHSIRCYMINFEWDEREEKTITKMKISE